jgi:cytoskeletal protein CcmA (bactofilin family)
MSSSSLYRQFSQLNRYSTNNLVSSQRSVSGHLSVMNTGDFNNINVIDTGDFNNIHVKQMEVDDDLYVRGTLHTEGEIAFKSITSSDLIVTDKSYLWDCSATSLFIQGDSSFHGDISCNRNVNISSNLFVDSDSSFHGNIHCQRDVDISFNLSVDGDSSFHGDIHCQRNVDISSNLSVDGHSSFHGDISCNRNVDVSSNLSVDGQSSFHSDVICEGDVDIQGKINVTGNISTLGLVKLSGLTIGDNVATSTINDILLDVRGQTYIWGDSNLGGVATLLNANINAKANIHDLSANTIRFVQRLDGPSFSCDQNGNMIAQTATINGDTNMNGKANIHDLSANTIRFVQRIDGPSSFQCDPSGRVKIGDYSINKMNLYNLMLDVQGQCHVLGNSTFNGNVYVQNGNANISDVSSNNIRFVQRLDGPSFSCDQSGNCNINAKANIHNLSANTIRFVQRLDGPSFSCDQSGNMITQTATVNGNCNIIGLTTLTNANINAKANIHDLSANTIRFVQRLDGPSFSCDQNGNMMTQTATVNGNCNITGKANIHDLSANKIRFVEELNGTGFTCDRSGNIIAESAYFNYNTVALGGITAGNLNNSSTANQLMLDVRGQAKIHGRSDFSLMFGEGLTLGKTDNSTINNNLFDVHGRINVRGNTNLGGTTTLFDVNIGNKANVTDLSTNTLFFTQRIDGPGGFSCSPSGDIIAHSAYFNYNTVALGGMTVGHLNLSTANQIMLDVRGQAKIHGRSDFSLMFGEGLTLGDSITLPPQNASTINSNLFDVRGRIIVYGNSNFGGTAQFVNINHSGGITNNSDYRLKRNITTLDETCTVNNLHPVRYFIEASEKEQIGLIAHELQEHFPSLVYGEKDDEKMQAVNYMGLIGVLINDIKSLNKKIDSLQEQIDALRA